MLVELGVQGFSTSVSPGGEKVPVPVFLERTVQLVDSMC